MTVPVYDVPKVCHRCDAEWLGKSFHPAPPEGRRLLETCDACRDADDANAAKRITAAPRERLIDTDIAPPSRTGDTEVVSDVMRRLEILP